jgi:lytic murein transglycosylase B
MTERRIVDGRAFIAEHREALAKVEADTGVPAEMIAAIIGVETNYGRNTGSHRVLDALFTLGAHYPPRQPFFRSELGHVFKLAAEEGLDIAELKGSYAGAMGWGQFMPSSYRAYARDGDGDGRRDLFGSLPDVFASIANYFVAHGWQRGQPVAVPATLASGSDEWSPGSLEASHGLADLAARGYRPLVEVDAALPATVVNLEGERGPRVLARLQEFLRDQPLQPLAAVFAGGLPALAGPRRPRRRRGRGAVTATPRVARALALVACLAASRPPPASRASPRHPPRPGHAGRAGHAAFGRRTLRAAHQGRRSRRAARRQRHCRAGAAAEPLSRYGNRSPYTVLGRSYQVLPSAEGYVERGIASWYGTKFHGRPTSSFEPYDMYKFTAAHKSLPLPSSCASPTSRTAAA